jgi:hypothetical protein
VNPAPIACAVFRWQFGDGQFGDVHQILAEPGLRSSIWECHRVDLVHVPECLPQDRPRPRPSRSRDKVQRH